MEAGNYKYIIKILQPVTDIDDYGESKKQYVLQRTTRASVRWSSGKKSEINSELFIPNQLEIVIHRYIEINDDTRIELQGKTYRVIEYHDDLQFRDKVLKIEEINK